MTRTTATRAQATSSRPQPAGPPGPRLSPRELELLFGQLSTMVNAGVMLERALKTIEQSAQGTKRAQVAGRLAARMRQGLSPGRAFAEDTVNFDPSLIALIRSSELTGDIGPVLAEIERLIVARNQLRTKIQTALIYPAILSVVALASVLTILLLVIPQFSGLVASHKNELPVAARVVFWLSATVQQFAWPVAAAMVACCLLITRAVRARGAGAIISAAMALFPGGRAVAANVEAAQFLRLLGTLLTRNVRLMPALDVATNVIGDGPLARSVMAMRERLKMGIPLAAALEETGQFPALAVQLAKVGEETGQSGPMLTRAARMLDDDTERLSKLFIIWFEPMLLAAIGIIIGGLLYGLFSAILSINTLV
jgi:type II secretory pathway component PulF